MTPQAFIAHWKNNATTERAGAQQHFSDLCDRLAVAKPRDPESYCFERGAGKSSGGNGWADVRKRGHFGWENKKPWRDLNAALKQLTDYALQLDNPPLLVVCDRERIVIHTAFTGYPDESCEIRIEQLVEPEARQTLKWVFTDPATRAPLDAHYTDTGPIEKLIRPLATEWATLQPTLAAGLVSTNSIRGGANRKVLERIVDTTRIFEAWSDEEWGNEGAAVRVSLVGFGRIFPVDRSSRLDGAEATSIHADLTADEGLDLTKATRLQENAATAARRLNELREAWLNPPEWVDWAITPEEEKAGFPPCPVAKPGHGADLKKRTLTNLYNARPAWLDIAHKALDQAVAAAYGWPDYAPETPDEKILRRLLALNLERSNVNHVQ